MQDDVTNPLVGPMGAVDMSQAPQAWAVVTLPLFKVIRQSNDLPMPYHVSIKILTDVCVLDFC